MGVESIFIERYLDFGLGIVLITKFSSSSATNFNYILVRILSKISLYRRLPPLHAGNALNVLPQIQQYPL